MTRMKGPIPWMAGNSVAANLLMLVFLVGGVVIGFGIKQEVFPDFEIGVVNVSVAYPGAGPEEVESGIILAIEEAVQDLDGVDEMRSTAREGGATVSIEVLEGVDTRSFAQEVEARVNGITSFPDEAERPMVTVVSRRSQVISYAVFGQVSEQVLRQTVEQLRDRLLLDPGITQVEIQGARDYEIHIEIPQDNLRRYGLTLRDVSDTLRNASVELPGGSLKTQGGEILVRMDERRELAREYARLAILSLKDGSRVLLEDIAEIREGFSETSTYATFNSMPALMIEVYQVGKQKPLEISKAVQEHMEAFRQSLPEGIDVAMVRDLSEIFEQRAGLLLRNGYLGLGLVFILLALFLEIRLAFWVSLGIPISILGSFIFLAPSDFSINVVSMFAFIVTLGIVVDDAIVVGENVYYYRQEGRDFMAAAVLGARDVAVPVTFSILTNVTAFMPILFVPGRMGSIFKIIPMVVITVFLVSLVESLFILPAHLAHQPDREPRFKPLAWLIRQQQKISRGLERFVEKVYRPLLGVALRNRYSTLAAGIALLIVVTAWIRSDRIATTLMPRVESDYAYVTVTLPYGSSDGDVARVLGTISAAAREVIDTNGGDALSRGVYAQVNDNVIAARILLTPPDVRPLSTTRVTDLWRQAVGTIPGLETITFQADRGGPGSGSSLTIELSHRNIDTLKQASERLAEELALFPNTRDIDDGSARGKEQFNFNLLPYAERSGLTARDVALQVRYAFYGSEALKFQRGRSEVTVVVRLPKSERSYQKNLENLILAAPDGSEVLLRDSVVMERTRAYTSIERRAGRRVSTVTANVVPRDETTRIISSLKAEVLPVLQQEFPELSADFQGRQADMQESTASLIKGLIMALFGIYALLAIPFRSYIQPMIIMACIPFGIVGAVIGHVLLGYSLSLMSLFGLVALTGVVVNDSLVMIDFANRRQRAGSVPIQAIHEAAAQRFRPIMLTTLTTFGGLAPMIFETSRQARFIIPMAISLGFGIVFATAITLVMIPTLYMVIEDIRSLLRPVPTGNLETGEPVCDFKTGGPAGPETASGLHHA